MSAPVLQVESLTGGYGPSQVLFGIDLEVHEGQVITLLGRNGMGKTTSVRHLLGLNRAYSGEIRFLGQSITGLPADQIARRGMAVVRHGETAAATPGRWTAFTRSSRA